MDPRCELETLERRRFLTGVGLGVGAMAVATLLKRELCAQEEPPSPPPHFAPRAKRVIYLCQSGAPSQMDLFDYKPTLERFRGGDLPDSVRKGQRFTGMTATQERFPIAPSIFRFAQRGRSGAWVSDLLPHTARIVDDLCFIKSMHTEAINHDPAITFLQTGSPLAGRPSMGAWLSYGLGRQNEDLPSFVVMTSGEGDQPLYDRLWGAGFLPSEYQGVKLQRVGDPVLYLSDPPGIDRSMRRRMLDDLAALNELKLQEQGDPETRTRIAQYEMAFRMQASVPGLIDISQEPKSILDLYGPECRKAGTFAANCLLARRLAERGVRFIQLFHRGWDQHTNLPRDIRRQCRDTDQPTAALVQDLKQRGLLDDTLLIWGGEFGRTVYCQGRLTDSDYGRDHHPRCFTVWLAGGGVKPGFTYGETDDHSYNIVKDPVEVYDLNATILHCLGIEHTRLTFKYQGRHHRLTDVHGKLVPGILA
jgi:hypothetical protein